MPPHRSLALIKSPNNHKYPRTPRSTYCRAFPGAMISSATHPWHLWSSSSRTVLLSILVISITTIFISLESLITFQSTWHHYHSTPAPLTMIWLKPHDNLFFCFSSTSAQRVGSFNIGSGRVLDKIPLSGSGSGRVGVSKNTIGYFRVSFFLSGISGYFGYFRVCRVFSGISGFTHIY